MVTTLSSSYYDRMNEQPELHPLSDFDLQLTAANGQKIPYLGYIEAALSTPFINHEIYIPVLIVEDTDYNSHVPMVVGTNTIREFGMRTSEQEELPPSVWNTAFDAVKHCQVGFAKTTRKVTLHPMESKTIVGLVRKGEKDTDDVVTEQPDGLSSFNVCPRVVSLGKRGKTARVPMRICNLSAKVITIPEKANLCKLETVNVLREAPLFDQERPEAEVEQKDIEDKESNIRKEFGVKIDEGILSDEQKEKVHNLFRKWHQIFPKTKSDLGHTTEVEHKIELTNDTPFKEPYRRVPPNLISEVKEHLKEMLKIGAIRESKSPWSSNVVIVRKKDGTIRFCIDFRKLNQRTKKDAYGIPKVEDTLHLLSGSRFFSKLDLKSGYWQVEVKEEDKEKTAFQVGSLGFYECNRMPFGLCNAPATFQRLMERCMGDLNLRDCLIYLDDIIIFSEDIETHIERLDAVYILIIL